MLDGARVLTPLQETVYSLKDNTMYMHMDWTLGGAATFEKDGINSALWDFPFLMCLNHLNRVVGL